MARRPIGTTSAPPAILLLLAAVLLTASGLQPARSEGARIRGSDPGAERQEGTPPTVFHGRWDGAITPLTVAYVRRLLDQAGEAGAEAVLLELETPGGLDTAMREIIKDFLAAELPVIVYVHPSGARSGSAGVFITMAAHVAAMTPGTNMGAASPVAIGGQMDSTMVKKVTEDAAAYARSIATERNRNQEWAEAAVRQAVSATAQEALELDIIDIVAESVAELMERLDGRVVQLPQGPQTLRTAEARLEVVPLTFRERFLATIADPNIAYIFMLLGIYGLIFELQNPGAILPGVVGAICLVLAFMSFQTLPLNYAGVALILLAIVLFVLEIKITSHGLLSIGGVVAMFLGSLMLIDSVEPALRVSLGVIIPAVLATAAFFLFVVGLGLRAQRNPVTTGQEGLVGELCRVTTRLDPAGRVAVHGEIWRAESAEGEPVDEGATVEVVQVAGLLLKVRPTARSPFEAPAERT